MPVVIMCAVCNKPVPAVASSHNPANGTQKIQVFCHGQEDSCELTYEFVNIVRLCSTATVRAVAFSKQTAYNGQILKTHLAETD